MVNIDFRISFVIFFAYLTEILKFKNQKVEFFVNYVLPRLINWVLDTFKCFSSNFVMVDSLGVTQNSK